MDINEFKASGLSILIIKNNKVIFKSREQMLAPLVQAIQDTDMTEATAYDKIVGRAASLLFIHAKVKEVFAVVASKPALELLTKNQIPATPQIITENIMNQAGIDLCPMEKLSQGKTPEEFYKLLTNKS